MNQLKYLIMLLWLPIVAQAGLSTCYGTTSSGYLKDGVRLPESGNNFVGYSLVARVAGRTFVHSAVKDILVESYKNLETELPDKVFKYAETGFQKGGPFKPHKTHRNGLSVDFMTPVMNASKQSVHLPTHPLNKFGYDIELGITSLDHLYHLSVNLNKSLGLKLPFRLHHSQAFKEGVS